MEKRQNVNSVCGYLHHDYTIKEKLSLDNNIITDSISMPQNVTEYYY